jgi:hypothetical protein
MHLKNLKDKYIWIAKLRYFGINGDKVSNKETNQRI